MTASVAKLKWSCVPLTELTATTLYDIMQLRSSVFVVEQKCIWYEVDGHDKACHHLYAQDDNGTIMAYARLIPALTKGSHQKRPIISRVVVPPVARGTGLGRVLFRRSIEECHRIWPGQGIEIGAQARLEKFYESLGFKTVSEPYDEDGIMHVDMHHD